MVSQVLYLKSKDSQLSNGTDGLGFSFVAHPPLDQEPLVVRLMRSALYRGHPKMEATSADITQESDANVWQCAFRLIGDKFLEFKMGDAHTITQVVVFVSAARRVLRAPSSKDGDEGRM